LHVDNATQANKPQPAEVPEELPQDSPMEGLQTIEEKQEEKETDKIISATNEQVTNISMCHAILDILFIKWVIRDVLDFCLSIDILNQRKRYVIII